MFAAGKPVLMGAVGVRIGLIIGVLMPRNAFHTGMQGLGLAIASPPISPRLRGHESASSKVGRSSESAVLGTRR